MRVAIFGANGFLGRHLCRYLSDKGVKCSGFDVQVSQTEESGYFTYSRCNITDEVWWDTFIPQDYSAIFFFAGLSGPEQSFRDASLFENVNVGGMINLLRRLACFGTNAPKIIFPSSRLVYRGGGMVTEDSPLEPRSVYAANKLACESLLSAYHHRYGQPFAALRICVPYGNLLSKEYSYGTLGFFIAQAVSGRPITVYGDGRCRKTYVFIEDLCRIFDKVMLNPRAMGVFNVGGHDYSLKDVADMGAKKFKGNVAFVPWPEEALRVEMGDISLDATKLSKTIGYVEYKRMEECVDEF